MGNIALRIKRVATIGDPFPQVHSAVGDKSQNWGNRARSSPAQPNSAPSGTHRFHQFGATFLDHSTGVPFAGGRGGRLGRTSAATNLGG